MQAVTLRQTESIPNDYPVPTGDFFAERAEEFDLDAHWQRIEAHVAHRWTPRGVEWVVEGPGEWETPLVPAQIETIEIWSDEQWIPATAAATPCGLSFPSGLYRVVATVGADNEAPRGVMEAYRRFVEASSFELSKTPARISRGRHSPSRLSSMLTLSGAADMLRPYRSP